MNIIISGASRGIGKAIAEAFAADGGLHRIVICSRNAESINEVASELRKAFPQTIIYPFTADLSVPDQAMAFGQFALQQCSTIDVLVNNTGVFLPGGIANQTSDLLETQIAVNLYSAYYLTRAILPAMQLQNTGHIFNICSVASLQAYSNGGAYSISKFALAGFSQNLREELKASGIKVSSVFPGAVMTDSWKGFDNSTGRIMLPQDVARMVYAVAHLSPQACVEEIVMRPQLGDL